MNSGYRPSGDQDLSNITPPPGGSTATKNSTAQAEGASTPGTDWSGISHGVELPVQQSWLEEARKSKETQPSRGTATTTPQYNDTLHLIELYKMRVGYVIVEKQWHAGVLMLDRGTQCNYVPIQAFVKRDTLEEAVREAVAAFHRLVQENPGWKKQCKHLPKKCFPPGTLAKGK